MKYVYEVISTNIHNGSKDRDYFSSERAANKWRASRERNGIYSTELYQWRVWSDKDI